MQKNEHLHSPEVLSTTAKKQQRVESDLSEKGAEHIFTQRMNMLSSIQESLSMPLREALVVKIKHEKESVLEMLNDDALAYETEKKRNKVLDFTYFKKKPLNINNF